MPVDWKKVFSGNLRDAWTAYTLPDRPSVRSSVSGTNLGQFFQTSAKEREQEETARLREEAVSLSLSGVFGSDESSQQFVLDLIVDICAEHGEAPSIPLGEALWDVIVGVIAEEQLALRFVRDAPTADLSMETAHQVREELRRFIRFQKEQDRLLAIIRRKLKVTLAGILGYLPPAAFVDIGEDGQALDDSIIFPKAPMLSLLESAPLVIERTMSTFLDADIREENLFPAIRTTIEHNIADGTGVALAALSHREPVFPTEHRNQNPSFLLHTYLKGTPFEEFFTAGLPFTIPFPARFEHTHIVGGTGHGKTQLIQFLIHHDLVRAKEDGRSIVVIDSQGDLIKTIAGLRYFAPDAERSLADRYVLIDPTDIEHPAALNMFDFNRSRLSGFAPLDREKILNATVELYEYFFGALLGAELTQRQGLIFRYLARLLIEIPGATIHTLRDLMEDGEKYLPFMEKLEGSTRAFFATRFFDPSFRETKKQILARLWGVLSNSALERMFSHRESKIDLFDLMNSGKIIFINTAKDLLGQDGAAIFGRFFIALIGQATVQRSAIPAHERKPCFVYIDEAQDYFDRNIGNLLAQARKYKVGLVLAHQKLDDLAPELRASVLSNTTIKFAGGLSAKDAAALAPELRTEPDFLLSPKREAKQTHFACSVKNYTTSALSLSVPLGFVDRLPRLTDEETEALRAANRLRYCAPPDIVERAEFTVGRNSKEEKATPQMALQKSPAEPVIDLAATAVPVPPPRPALPSQLRVPKDLPKPGRGGQEHKYLQHLVKRLAEERGFRATIEEQILGGDGEVDVALVRGTRKIAVEISVTTGKDHELGNIEKCIAAGYREVLLIGATEKDARQLAKFIEGKLEEGSGARVRYASPETLVDLLDDIAGPAPTRSSTVRGYKVTTTGARASPEEQARRRDTLAAVVAKSLTRSRESP